MKLFITFLFLVVIIAVIIGLVVLLVTTEGADNWFFSAFVGVTAAVAACWVISLIIDVIYQASGCDEDIKKAGGWILFLIGAAISIFVTIWFHDAAF